MNLITNGPEHCDCQARAHEFAKTFAGGVLRVGAIVLCDCGSRVQLRDDQRDGLFWAKMLPSEAAYNVIGEK